MLYRQAPTSLLGRLADAIRARKHPEKRRHLHHRPQRQLHQRVRGEVHVLRVLSSGRIERRLRARVRRAVQEDRRDHRDRRRPVAVAGRPQPRPAADLVRRSVSRDQRPLSVIQTARAVAARSDPSLAPLATGGARGARSTDCRGHGQCPRRRRRNPGRPRPQAAALLRQGDG